MDYHPNQYVVLHVFYYSSGHFARNLENVIKLWAYFVYEVNGTKACRHFALPSMVFTYFDLSPSYPYHFATQFAFVLLPTGLQYSTVSH